MSRGRRIGSRSGYMHIIARGVNRSDIFFDNDDYGTYIAILRFVQKQLGFDIIAYCLMSNHVHMVIRDDEKAFSKIMQIIGIRYAMYFNRKYSRSGHLFQDRFKSRAIESEQYLLDVVKYIHYNPVKAGISLLGNYPWSSYGEYMEERVFCSTQYILDLLGSKERFAEFHNVASWSEDDYEMDGVMPLSDYEGMKIICGITGASDPGAIKNLNVHMRNKRLVELKMWGLGNAQIVRLTGLTISMVRRVRI